MKRLVEGHPAEVVAMAGDEQRTLADLRHDIATVLRELPVDPAGAGQAPYVLLVFEQDRYALLVALLATWARGQIALVPPDTRRTTLSALKARPDVSQVLHDTPSGLPGRVTDHLGARGGSPADLSRAAHALSSSTPLLALFASSDVEAREERVLNGVALDQELARWRVLAPLGAGDGVVSTAPVGHRWGFVGGLLYPFASGALIDLREEPSAAALWVASPLSLPPEGAAARVLSGGARLVAQGPPGTQDVMTSVATGPLAVRSVNQTHWRPLPAVKWENRGFTTAEGGTADIFEPSPDGDGFSLISRAGRSVDGLDLDVLETQVGSLPGVEDAALFAAPGGNGILGAFAGSEAAERSVQDLCARRFEGLTDVRRLPTGIPRDGFGRPIQRWILRLLGLGPTGEPRATTLRTDREGDVLRVHVPEDYRWFDGHFEGYPILPAAVQLHALIVPLARAEGWLEGEVLRFERLKFSGRIEPGADLNVVFSSSKAGVVDFEIRGAGADGADPGPKLTAGRIRSEHAG